MVGKRIYLYDSSLRSGALPEGAEFSSADRLAIAEALDGLGIDYVEGGPPDSGPADDALFAAAAKYRQARLAVLLPLQTSEGSAASDPALVRARDGGARIVSLAGVASGPQARAELGVEPREQIDMIAENVSQVVGWADETMFVCGHFFDGFRVDPHYALECAATAYIHGARWIVLCDSNGGTLPHEIFAVVEEVAKALPSSHIGIRCLNDSDNAVSSSLAAVRAGAHQVQGTFNGLGVRCGNANLASLIPNLMLKLGCESAVTTEALSRLTAVSHQIDARLNRPPASRAPYVGADAFSRKDGPSTADTTNAAHIDPQSVGNQRRLAAENQAAPDNISRHLAALRISVNLDDPKLKSLLETLHENEQNGLTYDGAEASFELLARNCLGTLPNFFRLDGFRVIDERRVDALGRLVTLSEASVRVQVGENRHMMVAEGAGPVHALDVALRKSLGDAYPDLRELRLVDYKVRILNSEGGTKARIRVMIDSSDGIDIWSTVGVSDNVIDASYNALHDGIVYKLLRDELKRQAASGGSEAPDGEN
ncbi:MAG: citramalate synthase [Proteobacteria bacterium]|nr:citramalate synthase [Pseudomonadota bacterium]